MLKNTFIRYEDIDGNPLEYWFSVRVVDECSMKDAQGEYHPDKKLPMVVLKKDCRPFTIQHESLHACIDFFRTKMPEDFNEIFDSKYKFGEEAFIHYYEAFCNAIVEVVNGK